MIGKRTRTKLLLSIVLLPLLAFTSGCVYLVVGSIGALGGYVVSPDTVEGITSNNLVSTWTAATDILTVMGTVEEEYEAAGVIVAKILGTKVTVTISALNDKTTKVSVKARKAYLPKIRVAQDVYVKVMSHLNEG